MNHRTESQSHSTETGHKTTEALILNIQKLMDEVEAAVAKSGEDADNGLGQKLDALQDRLTHATERVRGFYASARKRVSAGAQRTDEAIRSHPYESLAVTLGVGVLLGALLRRRD
jgi:ElaB/YqjD/DUF883 family membrane-anchored ribosome-binding protein